MHPAAPEITAKVPPIDPGGGTSAANGDADEARMSSELDSDR